MSTMPIDSARRARLGGFTLIELLITIAIIAILSAVSLGTLHTAKERARKAQTEALVHKLHNVIIDRWESYRTRRVTILSTAPPVSATVKAPRRRLSALRELMRMEMPDRYSDLQFTPAFVATPALKNAYMKRINAEGGISVVEPEHQAAECLYMIVTIGMPADDRALFKDREIGDADADGMPEFVDAWGKPILFLRWAPGFVSELQPDSDPTTPAIERNPSFNHDVFDPLKIEDSTATSPTKPAQYWGGSSYSVIPAPTYWGYALAPLIMSSGPDGSPGIYSQDNFTGPEEENPYSVYNSRQRGEPDLSSGEELHLDNIHNHDLSIGSRN